MEAAWSTTVKFTTLNAPSEITRGGNKNWPLASINSPPAVGQFLANTLIPMLSSPTPEQPVRVVTFGKYGYEYVSEDTATTSADVSHKRTGKFPGNAVAGENGAVMQINHDEVT